MEGRAGRRGARPCIVRPSCWRCSCRFAAALLLLAAVCESPPHPVPSLPPSLRPQAQAVRQEVGALAAAAGAARDEYQRVLHRNGEELEGFKVRHGRGMQGRDGVR